MIGVGDGVEPAAHLQIRIVGHVVRAVRQAAEYRGNGGTREIVGMDVIGEDVILGTKHRRSLLQPIERQARLGVDSRRAQDRQSHAIPCRPAPKTVLGRNAAVRARRFGVTRPRLADPYTRAIAIDAAGADIDESLRYNPRFCQCGDQPRGARIIVAIAGRRREVQHRERRQAQPAEAAQLIEIAGDRRDAVIS